MQGYDNKKRGDRAHVEQASSSTMVLFTEMGGESRPLNKFKMPSGHPMKIARKWFMFLSLEPR